MGDGLINLLSTVYKMKYMLYYIIEGHYIILMQPIRQRNAGTVSGMGSTEM